MIHQYTAYGSVCYGIRYSYAAERALQRDTTPSVRPSRLLLASHSFFERVSVSHLVCVLRFVCVYMLVFVCTCFILFSLLGSPHIIAYDMRQRMLQHTAAYVTLTTYGIHTQQSVPCNVIQHLLLALTHPQNVCLCHTFTWTHTTMCSSEHTLVLVPLRQGCYLSPFGRKDTLLFISSVH